MFCSLDEADAGAFLRALFPRHYRLGIACGVVPSTSLAAGAWLNAWPGTMIGQLAVASAMTALTVYSLRLVPLINAARDAGAAGEARVKSLHKRAVALNLTILLCVSAVLILAGVDASGML